MAMLVALGAVFFITLFILLLLRHAAPRLGLVDEPGQHRQHQVPAALVGGLAIYAGCGFSILLLNLPVGEMRPLLLGGGILVLVGVLDDVHDLPAWSRFVAQILAGLLMFYMGGVQLHDVGDLLGTGRLEPGIFSVLLTVFATVGLINAYNMVDGADGLAGTLIVIPIIGLYLFSSDVLFAGSGKILLLVAGAMMAFLVLNFPFRPRTQATVFLGDAGSMFLGFVLCWFMISSSQGEQRAIDPVTALWLAAVPLFDTNSLMLRRMAMGFSPFRADRMHLHHLLRHIGFGPRSTLLVILSAGVLAAAFGLVTDVLGLPEWIRFLSFCLLFVGYVIWTHRLSKTHALTPAMRKGFRN